MPHVLVVSWLASVFAPVAPAKVPEPVARASAQPPSPAKPTGPEFSLALQGFLRGEGRINPDFDDAAGTTRDFGRVLSRFRIDGTALWGPVTGFVQIQDARLWGFERSTAANEGNTDLHQGFLEISGKHQQLSGWVRAGRQEINYGRQRLIGAFAWNHVARSFDSIRIHGEYDVAGQSLVLDAFGAVLQPMGTVSQPALDPLDPDETAHRHGSQLGAVQFSALLMDAFKGEVVLLGLREDGRNGAIDWERNVGDIGGRFWGQPYEGLTYDAEAHYQFGRIDERDHSAWAWAAEGAYIHEAFAWRPGAKVGYAMASGESCTDDPTTGACGASESHEFFNFFPTNHIHYGLIDLFGWRNMRDLEVAALLGYDDWLESSLGYHLFQLHVPDGRWSNASGAEVGVGWDPDNGNNTLGHEADVVLTFKPWNYLMVQPGYGVFVPVGAGRTLAGPRPQHFVYLWIVADFSTTWR